MKKTFKILLVWCFFSITSTTLAFLPSRTSISIVIHSHHNRPSSSSHVLGGTIGNEDFSKIFGSQEAAERRTRDLASEWQYSRPNKTINKDDDGKEEISTGTGINGNNKNKQQKQQESEPNKDSEESVSRKTKPIKVGKYVPPPRL